METVIKMINLADLERYVGKDSRLIVTSSLDMTNINCGSTVQEVCDVCIDVREAFLLD